MAVRTLSAVTSVGPSGSVEFERQFTALEGWNTDMFLKARGLLLVVCCFLAPWASAQSPLPGETPGVLLASVPTLPTPAVLLAAVPDSVRLKMLAAVARGDITGAISMWQLATNRDTVPPALAALQSAFSLANRVAGPCARVAKDIYQGFKSLEGNPQYLRISSTKGDVLSWQNRTLMSDNNVHFLVEHQGKFYDAFTGPAGLPRAEYIKNLVMRGEPIIKQITEEGLTP
jgi:hypothetical protein